MESLPPLPRIKCRIEEMKVMKEIKKQCRREVQKNHGEKSKKVK